MSDESALLQDRLENGWIYLMGIKQKMIGSLSKLLLDEIEN